MLIWCFSECSENEFLVKICEYPDSGDGHGKSQIWSWKVMEKSWNFVSKILWELVWCLKTPRLKMNLLTLEFSNVAVFCCYMSAFPCPTSSHNFLPVGEVNCFVERISSSKYINLVKLLLILSSTIMCS